MGFSFNPTLWFVCRLCKHSLASIEMLKEHKLACHLGECIGIKCIVFEERLLDKDWMPESNSNGKENPISSTRLANRNALNRDLNQVLFDSSSARESFKNPYISLTRITEKQATHKLQRKSPERGKQLKRRPSCTKSKMADEELKLSQEKPNKTNCGETGSVPKIEVNDNYTSVSYLEIRPEQKIKKEFSIDDVQTPINSAVNETLYSNSEDVKGQEFIVAPNTDGVPRVQFSSTLIPASSKELEHQAEQYPTVSNTDIKSDAVYTVSEHQEITFNNESNDFDSNSAQNAEIKMNAYDSNLLDIPPAVQSQDQETNNRQTGESIQDQQPTLFLNDQTKTGIGDKVVKSFMCETCFAFCRTRRNLKRHMLTHSSMKPFKCSQCPSAFKIKRNLTRHQIVHGRETKFKCRFCSKCFSQNQTLLDHERRHTGDRAFNCPVAHCDYAALNKSNLDSHTRAKHREELGLQQFVCPICSKAYGLRRHLDEHIRSRHSDTTPFHCTHQGCSKKFKLKSYLQKHRKFKYHY